MQQILRLSVIGILFNISQTFGSDARIDSWITDHSGRYGRLYLAGSVALLVFGLSDSLPLGSKLGIIIWPMLVLGQLLGVAREAEHSSTPA